MPQFAPAALRTRPDRCDVHSTFTSAAGRALALGKAESIERACQPDTHGTSARRHTVLARAQMAQANHSRIGDYTDRSGGKKKMPCD
jgi:hypothetical protein